MNTPGESLRFVREEDTRRLDSRQNNNQAPDLIMPNFDLRAIVLLIGLMGLLMSAIIYFLRRSLPDTIEGLIEWSAAPAIILVSMVLLATRGTISDFFSIVCGNVLLLTGCSLYYIGAQRFFGVAAKRRLWIWFSALTLSAFAIAWCTLIEPDYGVRLRLMAALMFGIFISLALLVRGHGGTAFAGRFVTVVLFTQSTVILLRFLATFVWTSGNGLFEPFLYQTLYIASFAFTMLLLTVGTVLLANDRMRVEFESILAERRRAEDALRQTSADLIERGKELRCLYEMSMLGASREKSITEVLENAASHLPAAFLHSAIACARIAFDGHAFATDNFRETPWKLSANIVMGEKAVGTVQVFYLEDRQALDEGPFLKEERALIDEVARILGSAAERKQIEAAVIDWKNRYEAVIKASGLLMYDWNPATNAVAYGGDVERILGYCVDEMSGGLAHWMQLVHPDDRDGFSREIERVIASKEAFHQEYRVRRKDGSYLDVHDEGYFVLDARGGITQMVGFVHDVTARRRAELERARLEAQLRESQKMEALGTLAGGVAHDFNNALAAIIGNVALARQDVGPAHPALVSLDEIGKASRRAKDLVQQILAFGRRQKLERKPMSLTLVVVETARLMRATLPAMVELNVNCDGNTPVVLADAGQMEQVLLNLCSNVAHAVEDIGRPGVIDVSLSAYECTKGKARGDLLPGRYACLLVRDNGRGMDEATRSRIFEPFFTTKQAGKGTGLGLSVVHGIVQAHGASMEVESSPGLGSTFRIYLPAVDAPAAGVAAHAPDAASGSGRGKHVLYLDDEEAIIFLMKRLLERKGYRVSGYTEPRQALAAVRADPGQFDLAVTDYHMPGMSGLEVAQALKEIRPDLPVVMASGYISEELRAKAPAAGVRELIYKPNTVEDLCEAIARFAITQNADKSPA